ncbi:MAG: AAA family ATPase, partial [Clostridia bacterium]|nr:AAA family ATPase [Clostridia bacterium]
MRLLSCYIENYGKIKKQDFNFDKNLTAFCENNGFGKTTLASFIKAMFYGLEPYKSNSKSFCERMHFCPFDGGKFGGNLTFEAGGKVYKIERFFGEKSDTLDECTVYTEGKRTTEFGEEIGKAIFGIDAKSFERTVFISSDEIEISSTTSINAKLNNFIDGDEDDLEGALKILEASRKEYKKSRAGNDAISAKKSEIENLNYAITNARNVQAALEAKYA